MAELINFMLLGERAVFRRVIRQALQVVSVSSEEVREAVIQRVEPRLWKIASKVSQMPVPKGIEDQGALTAFLGQFYEPMVIEIIQLSIEVCELEAALGR